MKNTSSEKRKNLFLTKNAISIARFIFFFIFVVASQFSTVAFAQTFNTNGIVKDSKGDPIIGANVYEKGTTNGTITDLEGNFSVNVKPGAYLQISYIGFISQEVKPTKNMTIILKENLEILDEVVVVGYGTQKKINLTGAITSVSSKALENRPVTQTSQALAGLASGVSVTQSSSRPGDDGASIKIRGMGTFSSAGSDPLVLIDGLAASINDIDPNNVKSISILKDAASASIYGTRAANGVILIESKRGQKGKMQISYNAYAGWQNATALPDLVDSWKFATMKNEANINQGYSATYTDEEIQKFKDGSDPDNYPNVNHLKNLLTSGSGFQTNHNISFVGGSDKSSYLLSLGYLRQNGLLDKNNNDKYNFQLNIDNQLTNNLKLNANIGGYVSNTMEPRSNDSMTSMIGYAVREGSIYAGRKSDGTYGYQDNYCPEGWMDSNSFTNNKSNMFMGGAELEWSPLKDFSVSGKAGYKYYNYYNKDYVSELVYDANKTYTPNSLTVSNGWNSLVTLQLIAKYNKTIKDHKFNILGGISQEEYQSNWGSSYRQDFPNDELYELNAGSTTGQTATGSATEWGLRSFFGRINYSFKDRYLLEVNARYDGTSRFPSDGRWGLFPSVSAGWRISEESFMKDISWVNNLKLRVSWGKLGNQNIGNYPYQNTVSLGKDYPFGGTMSSGATVTTLANEDISWETTAVTDLGLDFTIFNKLDVIFDVFNKKTSDILYTISTSSVLGMTPSEVNAASVKNTGFEIMLNYHTNIGKVNISIAPNFSYTKNQVTSLASGLSQDISSNLFVGKSLDAIYGYVADGLFVDQSDIDTYADQPYSAEPGFVRYKDISGPDGVPDGTVDATYDRKVIGSSLPKYAYGITFSTEYKGLDFSMLFQGLGGYKQQMGSYQAYAFYNSGSIQQWQIDNRWTSENPDRNAKYIKLTSLSQGSGTIQTSTYWLRNASFLRCKNLQIGYTFPKNISEKLSLSQLRVYFSGQNLFSLNSYYKGWDPEMYQPTGDSPSFYPITAVYTFGLNIKF
jgi:TonB-dependent starch-binding outer membrane protein SusC